MQVVDQVVQVEDQAVQVVDQVVVQRRRGPPKGQRSCQWLEVAFPPSSTQATIYTYLIYMLDRLHKT